MNAWTRKKTLEPEHEDWTILRDRLVVGRVFWDVTQGGSWAWFAGNEEHRAEFYAVALTTDVSTTAARFIG